MRSFPGLRYTPALLGALVSGLLYAQPYVDPFQVRLTRGFRNPTAAATPFTHTWAGSDIPVPLGPKTYLLLSPYYERWDIDSAGRNAIVPDVQSLAFPVGVLFPLGEKWSLNLLPVLRTNGRTLFANRSFQAGGAGFVSWERRPEQKLRLGVYMNGEFFGLFVWPLLGADWKAGSRDHFFGLLPGRFTWEHQWKKRLYYGLTFRALTNSFRTGESSYLRIDDNQLSAYLDIYAAKHLCFTLEPGYGIARRIRTGFNTRGYLSSVKMGDGPFLKLSAAWRIRLAERK